MKEQPIVYVKREMYSNRYSKIPELVGYVVSKAYLQSETTRYFPNGDTAKEYEVEFIGYAGTDESLRMWQDVFLNSGENVVRTEKYDDFESCKKDTMICTTECFRKQRDNQTGEFYKTIELAGDHARFLQLIKRLEENFIDEMDEEQEM